MPPPKIEHGIPKPPTREELCQQDDEQVLRVINENPKMTQAAIAKKLGWIRTTGARAGQPNSRRVFNAIRRLRWKGQLGDD
jgi:hypothetical protein